MLFTALVTLTAKDKQKWLLFLMPLLLGIAVIFAKLGLNILVLAVCVLQALLALYFALACACERCRLPGSRLLTADENADFRQSGSVLGYALFAFITAGYAVHYFAGEAVLPLASLAQMELMVCPMLILIGVLLFTIGKMRFTPVMFMMTGLVSLMAMFCAGGLFIGLGIMLVFVALFAFLRKESRILPGIMLLVYAVSFFFTGYGGFSDTPVLSGILNLIPCLIAVYLSFVVYSQRKLPKF
jgi:hypothetical protein